MSDSQWDPSQPHNALPALPPAHELESRYVIAHKADYYRLLQAVAQTSIWTTSKIAAIRGLAEHTTAHVRARLPKIYTRELVDVIFEQPYCRIGNLVDKGIAQRQACLTLPARTGRLGRIA
ncbi:MAG: hypothetical protein WC590_06320 [Burkholderiaceae bacterium]